MNRDYPGLAGPCMASLRMDLSLTRQQLAGVSGRLFAGIGILHINHDVDDVRALNQVLTSNADRVEYVTIDYSRSTGGSRDLTDSAASQIQRSVDGFEEAGLPFLVVEDGGHFARRYLLGAERIPTTFIASIEQTTAGERVATDVMKAASSDDASGLPRMVSVARSRAKTRVENHFLSERMCDELNVLLLSLGETLYFRNVFLLGYGVLGRSLAHKLRSRGCNVFVSDLSQSVLELAQAEGFQVVGFGESPYERIDVVVGATGKDSLSIEQVIALNTGKRNLYVASCSSGALEFETATKYLEETCDRREQELGLEYRSRHAGSTKSTYLLADGKPINFFRKPVRSLPWIVADLINALLVSASFLVLGEGVPPGLTRFGVHAPGEIRRTETMLLKSWAEIYGFDIDRVVQGGTPALGPHPLEELLPVLEREGEKVWN